ncbi:class I SAM-dependent methyltransferase [Aestuariivirga sp.]|uniref:class I SAM-dependent methyltransferase n=1 Tax=Aestuariivirga sp. TaxID=2650926 RepID=UPI00359368DB
MSEALPNVSTGRPNFDLILDTILKSWPQHERYLRVNVAERDGELMDFSEELSAIICKLGREGHDGLASLVEDYRFICEKIVLPEELYFRRHGTYRLKTFEEAFRTVYSDRAFMTRYMNGLLVTDVIWINHCRCMMNYRKEFLPMLKEGASLLEIGPGHGLLLYLADAMENVSKVTAWDVSDASLALAASTLKTMAARRPVTFEKRNIFDASIMNPEFAARFDGIVLSEVLEHLEDPLKAIEVLYHACKPGGLVWINVPANSPAPDHLYLVSDISEPVALVKQAGFEVVAEHFYPTSGTTPEKARARKLTANCVIIARKPVSVAG